ncbi:type II toxin-antitoxin system CcdA family antitoxin [Methanobrevibacter sp.]|uniref:type II toxin-antitoxin system CcdA family antitoxin n=1 Tax=Methanobrevibacter sp. TaxID=66852 RepID=UPI0025CFEC61|nr:type II toxin-antitoxin system CcdA family antitoxin [Methanobrevibacter sp.]MBQ6512077.1 type II toxin-antitoxin system CcdA family antitoxin [Methanobrevibacter sp.]
MKQQLKVSIEEDILKLAKEHIPNISKFVEECLIAYFKFTAENDEQRGEELRKNWEDFHRAKLNIHLLMNVDTENKHLEKMQDKNKKLAWLGIWKTYKFTETYQPHAMEEACKVLNLTEEELKVVLEDTGFEYAKDKTKAYIFDSWKYIEENILPHINLEEDEEIERLLKEVMG